MLIKLRCIMSDSKLLKEFIQVKRTPQKIEILVCKIGWEGPHTPFPKWVVAETFPVEASEDKIQDAAKGMLENTKYFLACIECGERNPIGWMHEENLCQGCASTNHGVVY